MSDVEVLTTWMTTKQTGEVVIRCRVCAHSVVKMVEEKSSSPEKNVKQKPISTLTQGLRPKPAYLWTVNEVQKWFKRHCGEYERYAPLFAQVYIVPEALFPRVHHPLTHLSLQHEISGQALLRITDNTLLRMGIKDDKDREAIMREIGKQRLKTDIVDFRDLESMNAHYDL